MTSNFAEICLVFCRFAGGDAASEVSCSGTAFGGFCGCQPAKYLVRTDRRHGLGRRQLQQRALPTGRWWQELDCEPAPDPSHRCTGHRREHHALPALVHRLGCLFSHQGTSPSPITLTCLPAPVLYTNGSSCNSRSLRHIHSVCVTATCSVCASSLSFPAPDYVYCEGQQWYAPPPPVRVA